MIMNPDMLNEVRPQGYNRRRQRSRRKKSAVTIESIHPGRAPLGVCRPSRSISPPTLSRDRATSSEWFSKTSESSSTLEQSSNPVYLHCSDSLLSESTQQAEYNRNKPFLSINSLGEIFGEGKWVDYRAKDMAIRGTSSSDADPNAPPSAVSFDMSRGYYELAGFDELASSQPVALSDLCIRARPRYKGNRNRKPPLHEHEGTLDENNSAVGSFTDSLSKPRSRLSALHQLKNGVCNLSGNQHEQRATAPLVYHGFAVQEARKDEIGEQESHESVSTCYQRNPLSYSNIYDGTHSYTLRHRYDSMSTSTLVTNKHYRTSQMDQPADTPRTTNESASFGSAQVDSRHHNMLSEKKYPQDSPLNLYRASFDHPSDRSPYESLRIQRVQAYLRSVSSTLQQTVPENQYVDYRHVKQTSVQEAAASQNPTEEDMVKVEAKPASIKLSLPYPSLPYIEQPNREETLFEQSTNPTTPNPLKDQERCGSELTPAALLRMVQGPSSGNQQTYIPDPFITYGDANRASYREGNDESMELAALVCGFTELKARPTPAHQTNRGNTVLKNSYERVMLKELREGSSAIEKADGPGEEETFENGVLPGSRCQPTPGASRPGPVDLGIGTWHLTKYTTMVESKRGNADTWFHIDGRGEEGLRQQIENISDRYAQVKQNLDGSDPTHAGQMTSLLGNAITNLYSYVAGDRREQAANFADFGNVRDCYCEPSLGGRRSYFERGPSSTDLWGAPGGGVTIGPDTTGTDTRTFSDMVYRTRGACADHCKETDKQEEENEKGQSREGKSEKESDTDGGTTVTW
ncbi:hypothetical protein P168DRAFT_114258 [Aspergillus campestris IBT 28561]|uniref:Uncharacterized protein n=1 Tax=Aspergillus campestris (strain IBT 28561) TaxID=1392248 RepID=A0A2I1D9K0_ASPC2|nr:uncharacterized protein P168DRAFT_114258 [Aspergillus campestris IBT 28561]PKY06563.1 hypothetical protein P168DRAFT_114258 [Aspergillus campestris IBT 28561]